MQTYKFDLFADYFQFYLQDESAKGDLSASWTEEAVQRLLAIAPDTIGVGTVRNMTVPVQIEVTDAEPSETFDKYDHIVECSFNVPTGKIVVAGCTDYFPKAARIQVPPGCYRVRVFYGGLDTLRGNGLEGDDFYKVILWPSSAEGIRILKQRQAE